MAQQGQEKEYFATGETLEEAVATAHRQIEVRPGFDFTTSRVADRGMQLGGFITRTIYWVKLVEDPDAPFYPDP